MSQSNDWLRGLNPEQIEAVNHDWGPMLILAGAGSGKTTVLVSRAGRLVDTQVVPATKLCVLTFTNKAAKELKHRLAMKLGRRAQGIWAGTFHSFGMNLLREFHEAAGLSKEFGILSGTDATAVVREVMQGLKNPNKSGYDADRLISYMGEWRHKGKAEAEASRDDEYEEATEWLLPRYLQKLQRLGVVDFDSLLLKPLELMKTNKSILEQIQAKYAQVMVDEFQDTNEMQMRFLRMLCASHENLSVVGDDDQAIYGWRGADVSNILDFPKQYVKARVVRLERNYRSTKPILDLANNVITKNIQRHPKQLRAEVSQGEANRPELLVFDTEADEVDGIVLEINRSIRGGIDKRELAVLYRSNSQGALIEAELRKQQIPYLISGGTAFFDRREVRDVLAFLRSAVAPNELSLRRVVNLPPRGIGDKTIETLSSYQKEQSGFSFLSALRAWNEAGVDEKAGQSIEGFFEILRDLVVTIGQGAEGLTGRVLQFFEKIGYRRFLESSSPNLGVGAQKWRAVEVFTGVLERSLSQSGVTPDKIRSFIESMELRDIMDDKKESESRIQLMTLHASKGLEFHSVFLIGLEEDLLPHKTLGLDLSEERRLFYVGVTRAKKRLVLSRARQRKRNGRLIPSAPSRFLVEVPPELLDTSNQNREPDEAFRKGLVSDLFKKLDALDAKNTTKRVDPPSY